MEALDREYDMVMDVNIVPEVEREINEISAIISSHKQYALWEKKNGRPFPGVPSISMEEVKTWESVLEKIKSQFEDFKKSLKVIHKREGAFEYALWLSELIGLDCSKLYYDTREKVEKFDAKTNEKIKDILELSREKEAIWNSKYKSNMTDEEKYQLAAQSRKKTDAIDKKINNLIEE